jgi:uncharacterized protein YcfJ
MKLSQKLVITSLFISTLSLTTGCSTWDKLDNTERGAVIGTGSGAVLGGSTGSATGAVLGGAAGGIAGGLIGHEVDNHDRRARRRY